MITASFSDVKIEVILKKMLSYGLSKQMRKTTVILLSLVFLSVCSLFRTKIPPYPSGVVFPLINDTELAYEGEIINLIQKSENRLYLSTRKGRVYCIDGQKRKILWRYDAAVSLASAPHLGEDSIYVFDEENTLYCLDSEGQLQWKKTCENRITSGIKANNKKVYIGTEKGDFFCLSSEDGRILWHFQADDAIKSNPVTWRSLVLFGCDDHRVYFLNQEGRLSRKFDAGGKLGPTLFVDGDFLYFGSEDRYLYCVNLNRAKTKWKIRTGGATFIPPVVDKNKVYFLCWNSVVYCLNKKSGTILWWNSVPSRSFYRLEVIGDKIIASTLSSKIVCFDLETGEKQGTFDAFQEIKSNPVWFSPFLLVNLYDRDSNLGKLVFLKKEVKVTLSSSNTSPQKLNEEVIFTARATGFYMPKYEFLLNRFIRLRFYPGISVLIRDGDKNVVQQSSESDSWNWFPEQEGYYIIEVIAVDEKGKAENKFPFIIEREEPRVSLSASRESPQEINNEIVFTAKASGMISPQFEFLLSRLIKLEVLSDFFVFSKEESVVQELSEKDSWTWTPKDEGFFLVKVRAVGKEQRADSEMAFAIKKPKEYPGIVSLPIRFFTPFPHRSSRRLRNSHDRLFLQNMFGVYSSHFPFSHAGSIHTRRLTLSGSIQERLGKAKSSMVALTIPGYSPRKRNLID